MYSCMTTVFCLFLGFVAALPSHDLARRQAASFTVPTALASPTSFTTTNTIQTANGAMTETCLVSLIPVGQQIQEIQNCTMFVGSSPMAAAAFVMPGTSIQVSPIGLGVFVGITSIAVLFVMFVTWERIQYRKVFRERRMAEVNSAGYGAVVKG